jgi:hypothetical protein
MLRRSLLAVSCVLSPLAWLATGSALAQTASERVPVILSKLPPQSSAKYKALRKRAGENATVEILSMTKSEVWSIAPDRIDTLKAAAARSNIAVTGLAADWNHLFRPMPAQAATKHAHDTMLGQSGSSAATMGVGMVLPPRAAMVEYALTRGAGADPGAGEPPKIVLRLSNTTALTVVRTSVVVKSGMCIWRGTVDGTGAPATLMWWPGVTMAGTVRHEGRIYSIRRARGGIHALAVVELNEDRMPPEHAPMPQRLRNDPNLRDDPLVRDGDASALRSIRSLMPPPPARSEVGAGSRPESAEQSAKRGEPANVVIRAMVAYTGKVARKYADIRRELVELAIEETNQSFRNSGLGHVRVELVQTYQTDYVEEGEHFDHLWRFADKGDGYMEEVHGLRGRHDADVALLIVDDPKGCGLATRVFSDAEDAFAVVHHECAATTYSVAHEIGHLIGARHELEVDKSVIPFPYGHGYVNGTKWRDIMSYKESCNGCPRLLIWSNPRLKIGGEPAGRPNADNARVIAEQAARVANFRPSRNKRVYTSSPVPNPVSTGSQLIEPR